MPDYNPHFVNRALGNYVSDIQNAVETGTYLGHGTKVLAETFNRVYSIELDLENYTTAKVNLAHYNNVELFLGNSSDVLRSILPQIDSPTLFWLDAHYMGNDATDWENSSWKGHIKTSGCINNDPTLSENQNPLDHELRCIYELHKPPAVLYIDDLDKFSEDGHGLHNKCFIGENWTHLNLNDMIRSLTPRTLWKKREGDQMIIFLSEVA